MENKIQLASEAIAIRPDSKTITIEDAIRLSKLLASSSFVPKEMRDKPGDILACLLFGREIGLSPMQSLRNVSVINGRPSVWGDAALAIVRSSPLCEYVKEELVEKPVLTAICRAKRRGHEEVVRTFSMEDARRAGLLNKDVWKAYPQRMLQMRARSWALRDAFPDLLSGLYIAEEAIDIPEEPKEEPSSPPHPQPPTTDTKSQLYQLLLKLGFSQQEMKIIPAVLGTQDYQTIYNTLSSLTPQELIKPYFQRLYHLKVKIAPENIKDDYLFFTSDYATEDDLAALLELPEDVLNSALCALELKMPLELLTLSEINAIMHFVRRHEKAKTQND